MVYRVKKLLAVGVIVLFLGLAFAPSINANISKASIDSELVEFTTEICGINGVAPNTVLLSKGDAEEVDRLFDSIRERLNATGTREETEKIFNEAVVELDKYGLLGGLSVEQAQKLVTGGYQRSKVVKFLEKLSKKNPVTQDDYYNEYCLIAGRTSRTGLLGPSTISRLLILVPPFLLTWLIFEYRKTLEPEDFLYNFLTFIYILLYGSGLYFFMGFPRAELGGFITFGFQYELPVGHWQYYPAEGWIWTRGSFGIKEWEDKFFGRLYTNSFWSGFMFPIGASGFTGLRIGGCCPIFTFFPQTYYLGSALRVKLDGEHHIG